MGNPRLAGVLLPMFSLPGKYGIGDFGPSAYEFIDKLEVSGVKIWQILPLNPIGYGNSPYQPLSSTAGDEIYIDLDALKEAGLISELPEKVVNTKVDYDVVRNTKTKYLKAAFTKFVKTQRYNEFASQDWVVNWSKFISETKRAGYWIHWIDKDNVDQLESDEYELFIQYIFYSQWKRLRKYANDKGIQVMGDIPIYVGMNSDDVWLNKECFLLDEDYLPTHVAGVPPDYFSEFGQRWGNPLYDWKYLQSANFEFFINRIKSNVNLYDIIRIDHFRALDTYYKIPSSCLTAVEGEWMEAPGYEFLDELFNQIPDINIVVEDLGCLRPEVLELRDYYKLKGMKVVQFTFDPDETNNDIEDKENMIIYTGTHDNETLLGWYQSKDEEFQAKTLERLKEYGGDISEKFLRFTLDSVATLAIIPIQDIIKLDGNSRINTPGTVGTPNWEFKLDSLDGFDVKKFKSLLLEYRRI